MTVISNILSILQKTVYPNDGDDSNFNTIRNNTKEANFTNSNQRQLSQSTSLPLSSSLSSLLSSAEAGGTMISGSGSDIEKGELDNVGQVKGTDSTGKVTFY